jgi:heme exporter protein B
MTANVDDMKLRHRATAPSLGAAVVAICAKDLKIELRTREIVTTAGFFAALVAVLASISFGTTDENITQLIGPGAIWLPVTFASVLALGRTWQREREEGALTGLLVSPIPRAAIFLGKALGVAVFVSAVEAIVVPIVAVFFHVDLESIVFSLIPLMVLGTIGIASTGTLFGAMTARTNARDLVLAIILFPLLSPTLVAGVAGTRELFGGAHIDELKPYFLLLGVFDAVSLIGGVALFGLLLDD